MLAILEQRIVLNDDGKIGHISAHQILINRSSILVIIRLVLLRLVVVQINGL